MSVCKVLFGIFQILLILLFFPVIGLVILGLVFFILMKCTIQKYCCCFDEEDQDKDFRVMFWEDMYNNGLFLTCVN